MCGTVLSKRLNEITKFKQSESILRRCPLDWSYLTEPDSIKVEKEIAQKQGKDTRA